MAKMWMIRSMRGEYLPDWIKRSCITIGWSKVGDLAKISRQEIKNRIDKEYNPRGPASSIQAGMLDNFARNIKIGDSIITYTPETREYYLAKVVGEYEWDSSAATKGDDPQPNIRKVEWEKKTISRDLLSPDAKNRLSSTLTLFKISNDVAREFEDILSGKVQNITTDDIDSSVEIQVKDLIENSFETLKDRINNLSPDEMEELIKEILNAMGYVARRTPKGPDRGVDVTASKDGLGLEDPRIFVEVKHRQSQQGSKEIRAFLGGRKDTDKCIFVSTGGFTKDAKYEAERSSIPISLIDLDFLAELVSLHYDNFRAEGKLLLPLTKLYLPAYQ